MQRADLQAVCMTRRHQVFKVLVTLPPGPGLLCSLAVPLDARRLLCSGNMLEGGPLSFRTMPVCGTAAGAAALAAEPAVFDITS
jgi:hypothetical protein